MPNGRRPRQRPPGVGPVNPFEGAVLGGVRPNFNIFDDVQAAPQPAAPQAPPEGAVPPGIEWNPVNALREAVAAVQAQAAPQPNQGVQALPEAMRAVEMERVRSQEARFRDLAAQRDRKVIVRRGHVVERDQLFALLNADPDDADLNRRVNLLLSRIDDLTNQINALNSQMREAREGIDGAQPAAPNQNPNRYNLNFRRAPEPDDPVGAVDPNDNYEYPRCTERGEAAPKFFIAYGSVEEYNLRLRHTFISYKGSPVYVSSIGASERGAPNELLVTDIRGKNILINLQRDRDHLDSRSFAPGYVGDVGFSNGKTAGYLSRTPSRVYRQGICNENTHIRALGGSVIALGSLNIKTFLAALQARLKPQEFTKELLKETLRDARKYGVASAFLSTNFALGCVGDIPGVYYRDHKVSSISPDGEIHPSILDRLPSSLRPEIKSLKLV